MKDTEIFKKKLEKELALLEKELSEVARKNGKNWQGVETDMSPDKADDGEIANELENFAENIGLTNTLEIQYNNIKSALGKIVSGTYGICEVGGEEISNERLEANPSSRTCIEHTFKK